MKDLKGVYRAIKKQIAEDELLLLREKRGDIYPVIIESWERNCEQLSEYFQDTEPVRKIIYSTNTGEGYHR